MSESKRRRFESTVALLQQRYGTNVLRKGSELAAQEIPHFSTGFATLDAITGCQGVPLGAITLLSGQITSGKLTVAYKTIVHAQQARRRKANAPSVALVDLNRSADPDYLTRCGVELSDLLIVRPQADQQAVHLLLDLVASRQLRLILVDSLNDLTRDLALLRHFNQSLDRLHHLLQGTSCALLFVDEPAPPWQRWFNLDSSWAVRQLAALHIELRREQWLSKAGRLAGYQAQASVLKSHWTRSGRTAPIQITFNGTVKAQKTW